MDTERIYREFIAHRRSLVVLDGERHHVLPRALGGGDEDSNLVLLSRGDHLFAHVLLARIHGGSMLHAVALMLQDGKYCGRVSRTWFALVREEWRAVCGQHMKGRAQSPRHLANRARAMRGNQNTTGYKQSPEHVAARIKSGWKHTPDAIEKMRQKTLERYARNRGERSWR